MDGTVTYAVDKLDQDLIVVTYLLFGAGEDHKVSMILIIMFFLILIITSMVMLIMMVGGGHTNVPSNPGPKEETEHPTKEAQRRLINILLVINLQVAINLQFVINTLVGIKILIVIVIALKNQSLAFFLCLM